MSRGNTFRRLVGHAPSGLEGVVRTFTEFIKGGAIRRRLSREYEPHIRQAAKDEFQERLMRAIVFEEEVREFPPFLKSRLESAGFGDSVGPAQIRVSLWAARYGTTRLELLDPRKHFQTMRKHLDKLERDAAERGMGRTIEDLASLWNDGGARGVTIYGSRVGEFDRKLRAGCPTAAPAQP